MAEDDLTELPGVGPATADKLTDAGYSDYQSIAVASPGKLSDEADVGDSTATKAINAARDEADIGGFNSAADVLDRRKDIYKISLQIPEVDNVMGGGVETQSITEVYGEFGAGKSQVTHQLCVNVQLPPEHGGAERRAIFIDTEDSFRPERISGMVQGLDEDVLETVLEREGLDYSPADIKDSERTDAGAPDEDTPAAELAQRFLDRIDVAKAQNSNHQMLLIEKAKDIAAEAEDTDYPLGLICVDSIMAHFRAEYVGRGELAERQQKLNKHLHDLKQVAELNNSAAVIANQVQDNPDAFFGDPTSPIGGNILGHTSTFRIYLKNSKGNKRVYKLVDAPNLPDAEAVLRVTEDGLKPE